MARFVVPGPFHQSLLFLLKRNPQLVFELARQFDDQFGITSHEYEVASNELPGPSAPDNVLHADWVIAEVVRNGSSRIAKSSLAVEVETTFHAFKTYSWLSYAAGVRRLFKCRGWSLVFAPDEDVRTNAQNMFLTESRASPWFVVPEMLPPILDPEQSAKDIDRAVLTTLFHTRSPVALACARATLQALFRVAPPHGKIYHALVTAALKQEQLQQLPKELLQWDDTDPLGPMELTGAYYTRGLAEGLEQGREQGLEQGREQGLEQGREQGLEQGRAEGLLQAIEGACKFLDIPIGPNARALLQKLDAHGLAALHTQLLETRRWPSP
jgi:hypothetical protein